jgi:very-short-patch-repair endonuclease
VDHGYERQDREHHDRELTRILRAESGLITLERLRSVGFSAKEVVGLVRHGDLIRLHRGVYATGRSRLHPRVHLKAALLALGPGSFLSGRSAAAVWGLRPYSMREVEVTVIAGSTPTRDRIRISRTATDPGRGEVVSRDGLRVSSIPRLLVELAAREPPSELDRLLTEAARVDLLEPEQLERALIDHGGRAGIRVLRTVAETYRPGPDRKSELERSFDRWLARHPELPEPQRNLRLGPWELDCLWPRARLVLELDGRRWHVAAREMERDRRKDAWLQRRGLAVLRVRGNRWHHEREAAIDDLLGLLALGQQRAVSGAPEA